ncbi:Rho GTPase activation protein [Xylona heveae TC161]|uniref:Rho GTPase activation protein n=1 Tax=Xylona heveae (strain CBS 132557 / TC161) TaxID=1328760 RepID=A0A165J5V5_XYLHT|nr:Rho GTPase activation protein [Xylona heveae TC161]KZF25773.1 Rho GTPase activation protein [Xylona heveae TC161]
MDGYGVHLAAGLIKLWYRELREPLFPSSSYLELKRIFGNDEESIDQVHLIELLSSNSQWSILPEKSRQILIRHLIPLLSRTAAFQDHNQMSPRNLAICFSATLLRGTDPIEDARMNRVIQRLVEAAVLQWDNGLREACGVRANEFTEALQTPSDDYDYEDPAEEDEDDLKPVEDRDFPKDEQLEGILLRDNDVAEEEEGPRPPLPPRPNQVSLQNQTEARTSSIRSSTAINRDRSTQ